MNGITQKIGFVFMVLIVFGGSAWGGWFSFEPNMILLNGSAVAMDLKDLQKQNAYIEKGDIAKANQLIKDSKVHIVKSGKSQDRVEYVEYEEYEGNIFVRVKDESGNKLWANMIGLACECEGQGKQRNIIKQDLIKEKFEPLAKVTP
ncbi:hypothetical protein [Desulfobacula sp.]|uniref:hypothetical protein n=1 Tax=Desulfobacula sp. TaxID=2593537 RepID=UPI0025BAF68A|nr:hypothetical protein [Desulfobacula sp.]MBC2705581.1 hypothetical protein [Desulfobacula sp.]